MEEIPVWNDLFLSIFFCLPEFLTILTSVELNKKEKKIFQLPQEELQRIENILKKAIDKESGKLSENDTSLTEDNPDGREYLFFLSDQRWSQSG